MRLGFIGVGRMGRPMVRRLHAAGHEVRAMGRSVALRAGLANEGVHAVTDIAAAADGAETVLVCVHTDEQVREVCLDSGLIEAMPSGSAIIVHTTGAPHTVEEIAARAEDRDIDVIDAPVSGGPHNVAAGMVTLFVGGMHDAVALVRPVLDCYGDPVLHVGPLGAGQRVKLINNALFAAQLGLLADAVRLGEQLDLEEGVLLDALVRGSAASRVLAAASLRRSVTGFADSVAEFLTKDVDVARKVAATLGGRLGVLDDAINAVPVRE